MGQEGSLAAFAKIGGLFEIGGPGVAQDYTAAAHWYRRALDEANDVDGALGLGRIYYHGLGVERDLQRAHYYYSLLEGNDEPIAFLMIGVITHSGPEELRDLDRAKHYYEKAATAGYVYAMRNLGLLYSQTGHIVLGTWWRFKALVVGLWVHFRDPNDSRLGAG